MKPYRYAIPILLMLGLLVVLRVPEPVPTMAGNESSEAEKGTAVAEAAAQNVATALASGSIGGYAEDVSEVALAVEGDGRIHALWTGKLNPNFQDFAFYSTTTNGVTWTPYQILDYWGARDPVIAVDDARHQVHLLYNNLYDGIQHHVVVNGVPGAPSVAVPLAKYYQPGLSEPSGGLIDPDLTVAEDSGYAHLVWQEVHYQRSPGDSISYTLVRRAWYAYWDGDKWSAPQQDINDLDTAAVSIAAAPDGQTMMAWFQGWARSSGDGIAPGDPMVPRTAYGDEPGRFPLRQVAHEAYREPERDESIRLIYAAGDDAFVLVTDHFMWPTHARVYRYRWENGSWSEPINVAENFAGVASPRYVGAGANVAKVNYVYEDSGVLKLRAEINSVLGAAQPLADYLAARGYNSALGGYFTDKSGDIHMVAGEKESVSGFYYVPPQ
jgi:hypothetical protein